MRQLDRSDQCIILDAYLMMVFIAFLQSAHYRNRRSRRRFVHSHHLETTLQCLVGFEIFLILVKGCRTYGPELSTGQRRLQDVGCIHGSGGSSRTYQSMDLVDEKDHFSLTVNHFLDYSLESFLEFSLILGSCDQGTKIQRVYQSALEVFRNVTVHDLLGDALRYRGLTDSRLTYQNRIVLGPPAEDLKNPSDLFIPADDRIELSLRRPLVEIDGKPAEVFKSVFCHIFRSF